MSPGNLLEIRPADLLNTLWASADEVGQNEEGTHNYVKVPQSKFWCPAWASTATNSGANGETLRPPGGEYFLIHISISLFRSYARNATIYN